MKVQNEFLKKDIFIFLGGIATIFGVYTAVQSFVYPRTEANASIEATNKRIDGIEKNQKDSNAEIKGDINSIKNDVNGIYKILINRSSGH